MKRLLFLFIMFFPLLVFSQKPKIEFQETSFNFGEINEADGKVLHIFHFKNTGTTPLILTRVKSGCGCTTPEWDRQPIAPGTSGHIKIFFDPQKRPGSFVKSIAVNSNASNSVVTLTIRGKVNQKPYDPYKYRIGDLKFKNNRLNFGEMHNNHKKDSSLIFINTGKEPITLTAQASHPAIQVVLPSVIPAGDTVKIQIQYDANKKQDWGFIHEQIHFTDNKQNKKAIHLLVNITEDFSFYQGNFSQAPHIQLSETEARINIAKPNQTYTHEFYIQNIGKTDLEIRKITTSENQISVSLLKHTIKPGKKMKAVITYTPSAKVKNTSLIQFITNDPKQPVIGYKLFLHNNS